MRRDGSDGRATAVKALFAAAAALAIVIGLALPGPPRSKAEPRSQFATFELGRG